MLVGQLKAQPVFYKTTNIPSPYAPMIKATPDGGWVLLSGNTLVVKYDACGNVEWQQLFGQLFSHDFIVASNGDLVFAGMIENWGGTPFMLRLDANGNMLWIRRYMTSHMAYVYSVNELPDGSLFFNGILVHSGTGPYDNYITKTDANGNILWSKRYMHVPHWGYSSACSDGGIITHAGGATVKIDAQGTVQWAKVFYVGLGYKHLEVEDGYVFAFCQEDNLIDTAFVFKVGFDGSVQWVSEGFDMKFATGVKKLANGNFLVTGSLRPDSSRHVLSLVEMSPQGQVISQQVFDPDTAGVRSYIAGHSAILKDGTIIIPGKERESLWSGSNNIFLLKTLGDAQLSCHTAQRNVLYPSPFLPMGPVTLDTASISFNVLTYAAEQSNFVNSDTVRCMSIGKLDIPDMYLCNGAVQLPQPQWMHHHEWTHNGIPVTSAVTQPGEYILQAVEACSGAIMSDTVHVLLCTGIDDDNDNMQGISVEPSPNPFSDEVTFTFNVLPARALSLKIFDATGREVVHVDNILSHQLTVSRGKLRAGAYFYLVHSGSEPVSKGKLLVE